MTNVTQAGRSHGRMRLVLLSGALALFSLGARAQSAPDANAVKAASAEEAIVLNPFEVRTEKDTSYGALNSTSVTRFNTELNKVPISADIFTEDFMRDIDATDITQMLLQYGAGMGMTFADASANSTNNQPGDRATDGDRWSSPRLGKHGLVASYIRRDGFTVSPTASNSVNNFDIERVEVLSGPQGLLYGAGGPGGTIVSTSKRANFARRPGTTLTRGSIMARIDQYGSKRVLLDDNVGTDKVALRVDVLGQEDRNRRLFIGNSTKGYYSQLAFKLPFNTIVRLQGQYTFAQRTEQNNISVNLGASDPRNGVSLGYLLLNNQAGASDPVTGQAYPAGAIANGHLDWFNYGSFAGWRAEDQHSNEILQGTVESVWTKWLSTTFGYNWNKDSEVRNDSNISQLTAPGIGNNPFNEWAVSSTMNTTHRRQLSKALHASALVTKDFRRTKTQTVLGYDHEWNGSSPDDFGYFLSDANGNVVYDPAIRTNLGRTPIPSQFWTVGGGPLLRSLVPIETRLYHGQDGRYYSLIERNPRDPSWVSPTNPWGTASNQYPGTGISGINNGPWSFIQRRIDAWYASNYTQWYDDWINTLVGFRQTRTTNPVASGGTPNGPGYSNSSYNLGLNGRITSALRWYVELSSTYDNPFAFSDPIGNPPPTSSAVGREAGIKFSFLDNRISGQIDYFRTNAKDQATGYGAGFLNNINPVGLNGTYRGLVGRNNFIPLNFTSDGEELTLTASPTQHWRVRVGATVANGRLQTGKSYTIIYNDQFYTNGRAGGRGAVTYADGTPFLVPVDPKLVTPLKGQTDPATILKAGVASQQLTTDMIGDPNNPYYAWSGTQVSTTGNISGNSPVGKALRYFNKPGSGSPLTGTLGLPISDIQYAWPDPANTGGNFLVARPGEKTVGYPVYSVNITNAYEFSEGWLRGVGLVLALSNGWQYRTYYYNDIDGSRKLYSQPELGWIANLNPYYRRKIGRYEWRTQLNISNLFNTYKVVVTPDNGTGYSRPQDTGTAWYGQPRSISWTNTISF